MLQRLSPDSGVSNEALTFAVPDRIAPEDLAARVRALVARHGALRTLFPEVRGVPMAVTLPANDPGAVIELCQFEGEPTSAALNAFVSRPFDLERQTPMRVGVWHGAGRDVCCVSLHHLVYDAWTAGVIFNELMDGAGTCGPGRGASTSRTTSGSAVAGVLRNHVAGVRPEDQRLRMGRPDPELTHVRRCRARAHALRRCTHRGG